MINRAIITGSNGFIGKHLKQRLASEGIDVLGFHHDRLRDYSGLVSNLDAFQPQLIFHLSSYGNLISQQDENEIMQANINDLYALLQATKNIPYTAFINFSSSSTLLHYETLYSATKGAGERLCRAFRTKYNKNIISVQPYTIIGRGEHAEHLIPTLIRSCIDGEKMRFVGYPVHDFVSVNDFVDAIKLIVGNYHIGGNVEIGSGIKTSNEEILKLVEEVTGKKANLIRVENMRNYDNNDWKANNVILYSLGWTQRESLKQIIQDMVREYKNEQQR